MQALVRLDTYFFGVISLFSLVTSFSEYGFHRVTLLRNYWKLRIYFKGTDYLVHWIDPSLN